MSIDRLAGLRRLYGAVLANFMRVIRYETRPAPLYDELQWLLSDRRRHPFAFLAVCDVLEKDPGLIRSQVLALRPFPAWMLVPPS